MEAVFATVMDDLVGLVKSRAIRLAAQFNLADLVKDGPRTLAELAEASGTNEAALYRLLRALTLSGYFQEIELRVFAQSELSATLRTDLPSSLHDLAILHGEDWQWQPWCYADQSLKTGEAVFQQMFGKDLWHYFNEDNPAAGERFNQAMTSMSRLYNTAITQAYDFSSAQTIVDVGGGQGSLLEAILHAYPTTRGILFDRPPVIEQVRQGGLLDNLGGRVTLVSGDFFEAVSVNADLYILKQIVHDWDDPECIQILSNCRAALNPGGRVLVVDELVSQEHQTLVAALIDLQLMLLQKSSKRTEEAHLPLFAAAGLQFTRALHLPTGYSILEAVAV
jgi:hypothetical protein